MDPTRFDRLTRVVSAAPSRRALVGAVFGAFSGIVTAAGGEAKPKRPCDGERCLSAARRCQKATDCPKPPASKKRVCRRGRCAVTNGRNGTRCTNSNPCIVNETCQRGKCQGDPDPNCTRCDTDPTACDDIAAGQCEEVVCSPQGSCEIRNKNGGSCTDPDPCIRDETCQSGQCTGTLREACVRCDTNPNACDGLSVRPCEQPVCGSDDFCVTEPRQGSPVCRAASGPCDEAATCDGVNPTCPDNPFKPSSVVCRPAAAFCDEPEHCTGSSPSCPPNRFKTPGTPCPGDGNPCTEFTCDTLGGCRSNPRPDNSTCNGSRKCCRGSCCADDRQVCSGTRCCLPNGASCGSGSVCCSNQCFGSCF